VHSLDISISIFFNSFAHRWWTFDEIVSFIEINELVKGGLFLTVFFFLWFQSKEETRSAEVTEKRQILLYTLLVCIPGLLVVRALAALLPFRARPLDNPVLHLRPTAGFDPHHFVPWSSFPSDHAFLFFALAAGMFLVNRKVGYLLYLHSILLIAVPRLIIGIHYPSDLIVGALLGMGSAYTAKWPRWRSLVTRPAWRLQEWSPGLFYGCLFFISAETAELYNPLRTAAIGTLKLLHFLPFLARH
jgi:undecaprenyl-diphosphatase